MWLYYVCFHIRFINVHLDASEEFIGKWDIPKLLRRYSTILFNMYQPGMQSLKKTLLFYCQVWLYYVHLSKYFTFLFWYNFSSKSKNLNIKQYKFYVKSMFWPCFPVIRKINLWKYCILQKGWLKVLNLFQFIWQFQLLWKSLRWIRQVLG